LLCSRVLPRRGKIAKSIHEGAGAEIPKVRRKSILGEDFSRQIPFFLFHDVENPLVLAGIKPITVLVLAKIQLEVVEPVLKPPHELSALRAFSGSGAEPSIRLPF
jgi:hypothetical protein